MRLGYIHVPVIKLAVAYLYRFLVDDVEDEWLNGDDFDFVHLRNMIPILKSPVGLLKQAYEYVPLYYIPQHPARV